MYLRIAFRANISAISLLVILGVFGSIVGADRANVAIHAYPLKFVVWAFFWTFFLTLFWLYVQSWIMWVRGWGKRTHKENTDLFLMLIILNFTAAYYFYWKRDHINLGSS